VINQVIQAIDQFMLVLYYPFPAVFHQHFQWDRGKLLKQLQTKYFTPEETGTKLRHLR
jgi:hypothetical protein